MKRNPKIAPETSKPPVRTLEVMTDDQLADERARMVCINGLNPGGVAHLAAKLELIDKEMKRRDANVPDGHGRAS